MNGELYTLISQAATDGPSYFGFIGALIGAAASIGGALIGSKKKQKTETTSTVDYQKMVREAEAAGFNPLTALRNGGSAGFSTSTSVTSGGGISTGQAIAQAGGFLADGISEWQKKNDPMAVSRTRMEHDLLAAQLKGVQLNNASMERSFYVPVVSGAEKVTRGAELSSKVSGIDPLLGLPAVPEVGKVEVTNPWREGPVDPTVRNAEAAENRYGDIVSGFIGGKMLFDDMWYNMTGMTSEERYDRYGKPVGNAIRRGFNREKERLQGVRKGNRPVVIQRPSFVRPPDWNPARMSGGW